MNQDISRVLQGDPRVQAYLDNMYHWFEKEFSMPRMEFNQRLHQDTSVVIRMFSEEPEIVYHDDPAKWAEILAVRWKLKPSRHIEFV